MQLPARGVAAFSIARRFVSASIIRCCAAVGGSAALRMRHTPCGCRSAYLVTHSVLHLLGYDHLDEGPMKAQMREHEERIMTLLELER